jgi:hypothetical protein
VRNSTGQRVAHTPPVLHNNLDVRAKAAGYLDRVVDGVAVDNNNLNHISR